MATVKSVNILVEAESAGIKYTIGWVSETPTIVSVQANGRFWKAYDLVEEGIVAMTFKAFCNIHDTFSGKASEYYPMILSFMTGIVTRGELLEHV